jgi:hypothetical protein
MAACDTWRGDALPYGTLTHKMVEPYERNCSQLTAPRPYEGHGHPTPSRPVAVFFATVVAVKLLIRGDLVAMRQLILRGAGQPVETGFRLG